MRIAPKTPTKQFQCAPRPVKIGKMALCSVQGVKVRGFNSDTKTRHYLCVLPAGMNFFVITAVWNSKVLTYQAR